jgi:hypothetical protein
MGSPGNSDPAQTSKSGASASLTDGSPARAQLLTTTDLQYVSIQLDGITFGGWYRLRPDGRMELMARGHMTWDSRSQAIPLEQAKEMLSELIRAEGRLQPNSP